MTINKILDGLVAYEFDETIPPPPLWHVLVGALIFFVIFAVPLTIVLVCL